MILAAALLALASGVQSQSLPTALVWIPAEDFRQWSKVDLLLRARTDLKLTVALTPAMATPLVKAALGPWAAAGRLEFAARLPGDPVLPYAAAHPAAPRPADALERTASARRAVESRLAAAPAGLVPGEGALDSSLLGPLAASAAPWVLVGPYAARSDGWAAEGPTVFVPARAAIGPTLEELTAPGARVIDESALAETRLLPALSALPARTHPPLGWVTTTQLLRSRDEAGSAASEVASWPGWNGAPAGAPENTAARAAWQAYGEAAAALERYQNSGTADMKVLEAATALLRRTQDARFYRAAASPGPPSELSARLLSVYRTIKASAPESLYEARFSTTTASAADLPTGVRAASERNRVSFDNPAGALARAPAGAPDAEPWRLRGLRVEWDESQVLLRILVARADLAPAVPKPLFDLYIDLNGRLGAGSVSLLEGRGAYAAARDAWEFALTVAGARASLWRAAPSGEPEEVAALRAEADPARGEVRVSAPRSILRGSPSRWGYILLALAEDPERSGRKPPAALAGPDGAIVLGLLAPLDVQKTVADKPGESHRVPACRLEP